MIPLAEFLELDTGDREDRYPFVWALDKKNRLMRVMVSADLVRSSEDRRDYWRQLKSLAGIGREVDTESIVAQARADVVQKLTQSLLSLAGSGDTAALIDQATVVSPAVSPPAAAATETAAPAAGDYESVWIETPECDACGECMKINPKVFAYNDNKQAVVINPQGGSFKDIVRAAEKCSVSCIHPGTPFNPNEKDLNKLVKRAEKYQ